MRLFVEMPEQAGRARQDRNALERAYRKAHIQQHGGDGARSIRGQGPAVDRGDDLFHGQQRLDVAAGDAMLIGQFQQALRARVTFAMQRMAVAGDGAFGGAQRCDPGMGN